MTRQEKRSGGEQRGPQARIDDASAGNVRDAPPRTGAQGDAVRHHRLDTIEQADDRTRGLDPHGGLGEAPIDDLLDGRESDADYREEARRVTPTLGPVPDDSRDR